MVGSIEFMLSQSTVDVQEPSVIIQFYSCKYGYHKAVDLKIKTACISVNKYCSSMWRFDWQVPTAPPWW